MKKWALFLAGALLCLSSAVLLAQTVTIAVGNYPPYTSMNDPQARLAQRLAKEAFALEGIRVIYRYYPWSRCYREAEQGRVDATLPWFHSKRRDRIFLFSKEPLFRVTDVFFHLKSLDFHWKNFADLKRYRLGGTLGYYDTELLEQHGLTLDTVTHEKLNFEKMFLGRIDAYPTSLKVGGYLIHNLFTPSVATRFTYNPKPLDQANVYAMFSRSTTRGLALRNAFDKGLKRLKLSGRYAVIMGGNGSEPPLRKR